MKNYSFLDYANSIERSLDPWYNQTAATTGDSRTVGTAREFFIENLLNKFLPKSVIVGKGQVTDGNLLSDELDIIIYRSDFPVINTPGTESNVFFANGVIAVIQVKSNLSTGNHLLKACRNLATFSQCHKNMHKIEGNDSEIIKLIEKQRPSTYIFAYKGWKGENYLIKNLLKAINHTKLIHDVIYYPSHYIERNIEADNILISQGTPAQDQHEDFIYKNERTFAHFFQHILRTLFNHLGGIYIQHPDINAKMIYDMNPYLSIPPTLGKPYFLNE